MYASIAAGDQYVEEFGLQGAILQTCALVCPDARGRGVQLDASIGLGVPKRALGDERRLRQILLAVVARAIRAAPLGSVTVKVTARAAGPDRIVIRVEVTDTGLGIDPTIVKSTLCPLTAVSPISEVASPTQVVHGCKLSELMGGASGSHRTPGAGSTVWFELPFVALTMAKGVAQRGNAPRPIAAPCGAGRAKDGLPSANSDTEPLR